MVMANFLNSCRSLSGVLMPSWSAAELVVLVLEAGVDECERELDCASNGDGEADGSVGQLRASTNYCLKLKSQRRADVVVLELGSGVSRSLCRC